MSSRALEPDLNGSVREPFAWSSFSDCPCDSLFAAIQDEHEGDTLCEHEFVNVLSRSLPSAMASGLVRSARSVQREADWVDGAPKWLRAFWN
jgi:hypothetical protein